MLFFYIRHGDPIYDPDGLTPLGFRQAEALARRLAAYGLDRIYVSSSERAKLTARPTSELLHMTPTVLDWANEGYAWKDLAVPCGQRGRYDWAAVIPEYKKKFNSPTVRARGRDWAEDPVFAGTRFAAGIQRIQHEADNLLNNLGYRHDLENNRYIPVRPNGDRIALFAHQGFGWAFLSCVLDIPYPQFCTHFDMGHSGMTVIEFGDQDGDAVFPKVLELANDSHLYRDGLPTRYQNRISF